MKKLFVLLLLSVFICTGFIFSCDNCEDLEDKIYDLESELEDLELEYYGYLEEALYYFSCAEENLSGQFSEPDIEAALEAVEDGINYINRVM